MRRISWSLLQHLKPVNLFSMISIPSFGPTHTNFQSLSLPLSVKLKKAKVVSVPFPKQD
jgi:hypothetical protein